MMNFLYQKLPKDLVYIIEDFAKDRTNYDSLILEFKVMQFKTQTLINWLQASYPDCEFFLIGRTIYTKDKENRIRVCQVQPDKLHSMW